MFYKANKNAAASVPYPLTMKLALLLAHCFCAFLWEGQNTDPQQVEKIEPSIRHSRG
jgi:hypothetical protein